MLLFQLLVLSAGFIWLKDYSRLVFGTTSMISILLLVYEFYRRDSPEFKITWMIVIAIIPVFGALMYIYVRGGFISKDIARHHANVRQKIAPFIPYDAEIIKEISVNCEPVSGLSHYLASKAWAPPYRNTDVKYYDLGEKMYADMKARMENAKHFIFLEFFIINSSSHMWREVFDILSRKVREGVEVRLLYDGMGTVFTVSKNFSAALDNAGINHAEFAPVMPLLSTYQNNRDHRKIIVIDGEVAFTGGINIADEYVNRINRFGHWKDNGVRITGTAVDRFTALFLEMWSTVKDDDTVYANYIGIHRSGLENTRGYIIPYGDCPLDDDKIGKRVYLDIINRANKYVYIMTPYLVLDNEITEALRYAVERGVDVKIIIPHKPDKVYAYWLAHTYYPELFKYGVGIYEYTPGFIHAKTMISDDDRAVVGTINFDYRSFYLHYECAVLLTQVPAVADIKKDFLETLKVSQRITEDIYKSFNPFTKLLGLAIRIVAPLL